MSDGVSIKLTDVRACDMHGCMAVFTGPSADEVWREHVAQHFDDPDPSVGPDAMRWTPEDEG